MNKKYRLNNRLRFLEFEFPDESWNYVAKRFAESIGATIVSPEYWFFTDGEPFCVEIKKAGKEFRLAVETYANVGIRKGVSHVLFFFEKSEWKKLLSIIAIP